jgi:Transposase
MLARARHRPPVLLLTRRREGWGVEVELADRHPVAAGVLRDVKAAVGDLHELLEALGRIRVGDAEAGGEAGSITGLLRFGEHWNELRQAGDRDAAKEFKNSRWALLRNPLDLTDRQADTLAALHAPGGKVPRAWAMKETVRAIFAPGLTIDAAAELIDRLLARVSRSRLRPFVRLGRTIRKHRDGILAARRLKLSNARAEAINNKAKLIVRRAYGFHSANAALALIHLTCGPVTLTPPHEQTFA